MISPFCDDIVVIGFVCDFVIHFGPMFSYQIRSVRCVAVFWLNFRLRRVSERWIKVLKYINKFEKVWIFDGFVLLLVIVISSRARVKPMIVMINADSFIWWGMVICGVFIGVVFSEISKPAIMLPAANRMIGLVAV